MQLKQTLAPKQVQTLKQMLHPKLIQMLRMFHHSYADLVSQIVEEAQENVFLEIIREDQLSHQKSSQHLTAPDKEIGEYSQKLSSKGSLIDFVKTQLSYENLPPNTHTIALELIDNLDNRGYIKNFDTLKQELTQKYAIKERKLLDILYIIQSLEPEGVGARTLKECLLIQIKEHDFEEEQLTEVLQKIVTHHLDDLAKTNYTKIAKALDLDEDGIKAAHEFIKENLNPNPGASFPQETHNHHVTPSFEVHLENHRIQLTNYEETLGINITLSKNYDAILQNPKLDTETRNFLNEKLRKATELIENIQKRRENMEKLAKFITEKQLPFLKKGPIHLAPLLQKNVAEYLHISQATVSRIVSAKYIQTPHGLFTFKQLCPRNHFGKTSEQLLHMVQALISEHPSASDQTLATYLQEQNIPIARRTVTKYRLKSGIGSSFQRNV
ncbi:MAG: RNA polymerase sigma-54 factor [Candidatus Margulisbacteria bacterium]|nr:RNA polymerase sigma-54 factor [Candidatus Margulisiibacteriota bacterium]